MKKNNVLIILFVAGLIGVAAVLVYFSQKNKPDGQAVAVDNHGHPIVNNSAAIPALNNLMGKPVPSFTLSDKDGNVYSSENLLGKNIILFFNEGLMCYPACWNQIAAFPKDERFSDDNTVVLSVVVDSKDDWRKAVSQMPELDAATVVFDQGAAVSKKFGVLTLPSSMHYGSLPGHTYIVIDKEGVVSHVFDDPNMALHNDKLAEEISRL